MKEVNISFILKRVQNQGSVGCKGALKVSDPASYSKQDYQVSHDFAYQSLENLQGWKTFLVGILGLCTYLICYIQKSSSVHFEVYHL